jgi:DedD protein
VTPVSTMPMNRSEDTEITLGTGKMLALFFGLVILCAVFFGMGFSMGKNSVRSAPELLPSPGTSTGVRPSASNRPASSPPAESKPTEHQQSPAANDSNSNNSAGQSAPATSDQQAAPQPVQPGNGYFVQVAAVTKQEDAEALVESLKGRQYSAFIANPSPDKFFHVQVGPFSDIKDAESMRAKLVSDGYNPILKK